MSSLISRLLDLTARVSTEFKAVRTLLNGNSADLSKLNTTAKSDLVSAVNELKLGLQAPQPVSIAVSAIGTPTASQVLARLTPGQMYSLIQSTSFGNVRKAPAASYTVTVYRNGTSIATFAFAAGSTTATVTVSSTIITAGDVVTFVAPATADTSIADLALTLGATR